MMDKGCHGLGLLRGLATRGAMGGFVGLSLWIHGNPAGAQVEPSRVNVSVPALTPGVPIDPEPAAPTQPDQVETLRLAMANSGTGLPAPPILAAPVAVSPTWGSGRFEIPMTSQGVSRRCVVYVPRSYDGRTARPLVVAMHASGEDPDSFLEYSNWHGMAETYGFIVLAPEGLPLHPGSGPKPMVNPRVWNSGQYKDSRERTNFDDVSFVIGAMDEVRRRWQVDSGRVYLVGYSNGGAMAFRLAAERADRFTAIASVSGLCWVDNPRPARSVPTLFVCGNMDPIVPRRGGVKMLPWEVKASPPVDSVLERWSVANGTGNQPRRLAWSPSPGVEVQDYGPGPGGGLLRAYYISGQGHGYPGGSGWRGERLLGPDAGKLDATANIWAFFQMWQG